jgi:hypothetical protein
MARSLLKTTVFQANIDGGNVRRRIWNRLSTAKSKRNAGPPAKSADPCKTEDALFKCGKVAACLKITLQA